MKEAIQGIIESEFLSGAFLLSIFAGIILIIKSFGNKLYKRVERKIVYSVRIEQTDELFIYMERWLRHNYEKQYRNVIAHLKDVYIPGSYNEEGNSSSNNHEKNTVEEIKYRQEDDTLFIRFKGSYIKIYKGRDKLENANTIESLYFDHFSIKILFLKNKIDSLLNEVIKFNHQFKTKSDKREIYTWDGYNWKKLTDVRMKNFSQVIIKNHIKQSLIEDMDQFVSREDWYVKKSIPYKRGYLLHGTPGNGKTSLSSAMADYLNRSIYTVAISEIKDDGYMRDVFSKIKSNSILLFEDVDSMFKKRKSKDKISFSTFLNCLDGVFYKHGLIVIMTTNHVDKLDSALIRPGRIDLSIEIKNPEFNEVKSYIELFFDQPLNIRKNGYDSRYPMAEVQKICMSGKIDQIVTKIFH